MGATLSLLICHLPARAAYLERLWSDLRPQLTPAIEVHVDQGDGSVGVKRNRLLARATGDFTAFIDDDDRVAPYYVDALLRAIAQDPTVDCLSLRGIITHNGEDPRLFEHSLRHAAWQTRHYVYYRPPNHLNAIARRHSQRVEFPDLNQAEDMAWSLRIRPCLQRETFVEPLLYRYNVRQPKEC